MSHLLPEEPPLECLGEMFRLIRSGEVQNNMGEFLKHAWFVAGYGLYLVYGNGMPPRLGNPDDGPRKFVAAVAQQLSTTTPEQLQAVPWLQLLPLVLQIVKLIRQ